MKGVPIYDVKYKRFLNEGEACDYVGMTKLEFRRECPFSPRLRAQGRKVWDVELLDKWQDNHIPINSRIEDALRQL